MIPVLFVDDEMIVRVALKSMVDWDKTEFKIVGAVSDGETALEYVKKYKPKIIVTDLKMPHLDGIGLAKALNEQGYEGKIIILSSFGEFEMAREAIRYGVTDYLLKANFTDKELLEALRKTAAKLPAQTDQPKKAEEKGDEFDYAAIYSMLYGSKKEDCKMTSSPDKKYATEYVALYIFKKGIFRNGLILEDELDMTSKEMLSSLISECIESHSGVEIIPLTKMDALVLFPLTYDEPVEKIIEGYMLRIQNSVKIYMNTEAGFVISTPFFTQIQLETNLKSCAKSALLSVYRGYKELIHQEDISAYTRVPMADQYDTIEQICGKITLNEYESAKMIAMSTLECFDKQKVSIACACDYIKKLFNSIMLSSAVYFEGDKNKIKELAISYKECSTVHEYEIVIENLINAISKSAIKTNGVKYRKEVMTIIAYVKENITQKITLTQVAELVNMNESYISRLFKNETGINLISFINMLKMEKSMELLKDPDIMVKEVANKLGYDEQSYFNRIFNKYFGSSPSEFKQNYQNSIKSGKNITNVT